MSKPVPGRDTTEPEFVLIPYEFLISRLPHILDLNEVHVTMAVFRLSERSNHSSIVSEIDVIQDPAIGKAFSPTSKPEDQSDRVRRSLRYAVARESLLEIIADGQRWFLPNTTSNRTRLQNGSADLISWSQEIGASNVAIVTEKSVFAVYEQNIGLLTPILADQLVSAMEIYPTEWIREAIAEAVTYNRRNWRYIQRILETWATLGRDSKSPGRKSNAANRRGSSELLDPDQYREGRHLGRAREV